MFDYVDEEIGNFDEIKNQTKSMPELSKVKGFLPLFWGEHCLECSAPECYKSCPMFVEDRYGRCRRTVYGMRTYYGKGLFDLPLYRLQYRKWAKLRCSVNSSRMFAIEDFKKEYLEKYLTKRNMHYKLSKNIPLVPPKYRDVFARINHHKMLKKYTPENSVKMDSTELMIIFYSFADYDFQLILDSKKYSGEILSRNAFSVKPYQWNIWKIKWSDLCGNGDGIPEALELYPENNLMAEILFAFNDLIIPDDCSEKPASKVKCVVWDLDGTIWDGVIGDDGIDNVSLNDDVVREIKKLDEKGILQSIASKNDYDIAMKGLAKFGISDYFLVPQINWERKSESIIKISKALNIGINSIAFVDDTAIEREEVKNTIPGVRTYSNKEVETFNNKSEFDVPVTEDSKNRRKYYVIEQQREHDKEESKVDYKSFIKSCEIVVSIQSCLDQDIDRCYELLQRTNQLNASTNRYDRTQLKNFLSDENINVLKISCKDKYGSYGTVGCLIIDTKQANTVITDFVISCRVANKKVESAIINNILLTYGKDVDIVYFKTERNSVLQKELLNVGGEYDEKNNRIHFSRESIKEYDWVTIGS